MFLLKMNVLKFIMTNVYTPVDQQLILDCCGAVEQLIDPFNGSQTDGACSYFL
jgi:hypothetical protein